MNSGTMTRLETFCNLGYRKDPLNGHLYETGDMTRARRILTMAVESRAMVSIVGERGCGKSEAVKNALKKQTVKAVWVKREDQEKLTIVDVKTALILNLSNEGVKRGGIVSSMQLRRIVGEASLKQKIVVVIEEAQRLHHTTLRSLKSMREIEWMGETELFTIVLVAQSDPMNRAGVSEVRLRSDLVRMNGLSAHEAAHYVKSTVGKHFEDGAIDLLSELPAARNYLELQEKVVELLSNALADGRDQVTSSDVLLFSAPEAAQIPRRESRKQAPAAPVTGATALANVLNRKGETTSNGIKGVINGNA